MKPVYYLAVDIGASSGRHILGRVEEGKLITEEVYRFPNGAKKKNGQLLWDVEELLSQILAGMKVCGELGKIPVSMGIDTWGVDFVLLDREGRPLTPAVAYRDSRTAGMDREVEKLISFPELYERTGIQKQSFNTVYQLIALKKSEPAVIKKASRFLMAPDYFHYRLTGKGENEYTNATTTALVNAETKQWDHELLELLGFPSGIFAPLRTPGESLGRLLPWVREEVGFDCEVILPATHDTGSAFLAVPVEGEEYAILSSGTWSLLGVENSVPITSRESRMQNFTNEGGYRFRFRYLKNIMGLWMLQSVRKELGNCSFQELEQLARQEESFEGRVDVNDESFLAPDSMIEAVNAHCGKGPLSPGQTISCIYQSLSSEYANTVSQIRTLTGREIKALHIVGGGSQDRYLNALTAKALGLPVYAGPTEGTGLGNLMVQMIAKGEFAGLSQAREALRKSFEVEKYWP